jgi:hypothetical protein
MEDPMYKGEGFIDPTDIWGNGEEAYGIFSMRVDNYLYTHFPKSSSVSELRSLKEFEADPDLWIQQGQKPFSDFLFPRRIPPAEKDSNFFYTGLCPPSWKSERAEIQSQGNRAQMAVLLARE